MNRYINKKGVAGYVGNYTPRHNEYERGMKYRLFIDNTPTGFTFERVHDAIRFFNDYYFLWL